MLGESAASSTSSATVSGKRSSSDGGSSGVAQPLTSVGLTTSAGKSSSVTEAIELWTLMKSAAESESGGTIESSKRKHLRFVMELEFVETLANPQYLHFLATDGWFEKPSSQAYLRYLRYWIEKPEYTALITHTHSLSVLQQLTDDSSVISQRRRDEFIKLLREPSFIDQFHRNQFFHWRSFNSIRASQPSSK